MCEFIERFEAWEDWIVLSHVEKKKHLRLVHEHTMHKQILCDSTVQYNYQNTLKIKNESHVLANSDN